MQETLCETAIVQKNIQGCSKNVMNPEIGNVFQLQNEEIEIVSITLSGYFLYVYDCLKKHGIGSLLLLSGDEGSVWENRL